MSNADKPDFRSRHEAVAQLEHRRRNHLESQGKKVDPKENRAYAEKIAEKADKSWEKS